LAPLAPCDAGLSFASGQLNSFAASESGPLFCIIRSESIDLTAAHAVDQGQVNRRATGMVRPVKDTAEPDQIPLVNVRVKLLLTSRIVRVASPAHEVVDGTHGTVGSQTLMREPCVDDHCTGRTNAPAGALTL
jgi:hypothetical protein